MSSIISLLLGCLVLSKLVYEMSRSDTPASTIAFIFVVASVITFMSRKGGKNEQD